MNRITRISFLYCYYFLAGWTAVTQPPQPQYVGQQIQLEDIRYHSPANTLHYSTHAPPNVYNQPGYQTVSAAQTPTSGFIQVSNGFAQQPTQVTTSSLLNGVPNVAPTINGNVEYLESSGRTDFVNGTPNYNHISQTVCTFILACCNDIRLRTTLIISIYRYKNSHLPRPWIRPMKRQSK